MKYTFKQFQAQYPDDATCLKAIMRVQYGETRLACPGCGVEANFSPMGKRRAYACQECGHHIYPCVGTIFEKSRTKLTLWFFAMYLLTSTRHGVAAKELERQLGVTYKCAWRMAHELRKLMAASDIQGPIGGEGSHIEIDETLVGGIARGPMKHKGRRGKANKTIVMGIVERGGPLRAAPIPDVKRKTLEPLITSNVLPGSTISTDELHSYKILQVSPYKHGVVNHSDGEYVRGIHYTNTLEGHWSQLKRSIRGTHVHVSSKHLWKYVSEFSYRRNYRGGPGW